MEKGKIIVLEGLDGCGKSTQLDLALKFLRENNIKCRTVSFPNYEELSGKIVQQYLSGEIPCGGENGAYAASTMYAIDRYISYVTDWKSFFDEGGVVVCGRYTTSNAIYQLTKLTPDERDDFLKWLFDFEYDKLGLPRPDAVIYLDMPVEVSQNLLVERYMGDEKKRDIHERDVEFLKECRKNALYTADQYGWQIIDCCKENKPLSIDEVHSRICGLLKVFTGYA